MVTIEINGKPVQAEQGKMLIEVADEAGITIPRFCYHSKLSIAASCRMCLVEVEKAPKPLPACATPVNDGMVVHTRSPRAISAQRSVMEFLLINHPLDCPICDQGGECTLQEMALGYGKDISRYSEAKRVVGNPDLGALIATDMNRCIHCTRCVRFGQELAGVMELGAPGRGEHMHISTYMEHSVDSELSGNVIDLCPVGALTSKPFRYSARPWELTAHFAVSPHDCVGSNMRVDVRRGKVMRVVPEANQIVNEEWLADRDRFSYTALNHPERLTVPMIKQDGQWQETDWDTALTRAAEGLRDIVQRHGAESLGAWAAYGASTEEHYLLQRLMRGLGSANVDHRLRQQDFRDQAAQPAYPSLGQAIADLEQLDAVLLVGGNIRKDQPLLAQRLRKAARQGAKIMQLDAVGHDLAMPLAEQSIVADLHSEMLGVLKALVSEKGEAAPQGLAEALAALEPSETQRAMASALLAAPQASVLLGNLAAAHPAAAELRQIARELAKLSGARFGQLAEGGNSAGAWLAGCIPHREAGAKPSTQAGMDWLQMCEAGLKGYLLHGIEPELDCIDSAAARRAMNQADFVVAISSFAGEGLKAQADVLLPQATFFESAGSYVNAEGHWQQARGCVAAPGEARPAWKILRVLGNLLDLNGFEYTSVEAIHSEMQALFGDVAMLAGEDWQAEQSWRPPEGLLRLASHPIYRVDAMVRRAEPLQATRDAEQAVLRANPATLDVNGLTGATQARLSQGGVSVVLPLCEDETVADGVLLLPSGLDEACGLGAPFAAVQLENVD